MVGPRTFARDVETHPVLAVSNEERFTGYGVLGLPFATGHVLAMRRFPASSIGPAYTSIWHRDPAGRWTFWQDQSDDQACSRYFGSAVEEIRRSHFDLEWMDECTMRVSSADPSLIWTMKMTASTVTRALNAVGWLLPSRAWRSLPILKAMGSTAGIALRAGRVRLVGDTPNGQSFVANPTRIWLIGDSSARLDDKDLGAPAPLAVQARIGEFWIPQRGVFAVGHAFFRFR